MKRDEVLRKLKQAEADLRAQGVAHAALFGSVARGEDRPDSDIDIMIEIAPTRAWTCFAMSGSFNTSRSCFRYRSMSPTVRV